MNKQKMMAGVVLFSMLHAATVLAGPADYVFTPKVEKGEWELDVNYGSNRPGSVQGRNDVSVGVGYGVTEQWFTGLSIKHESAQQGLTLAEWENKFKLDEVGTYPVDMGFVVELETPIRGKGPNEIRFGPLLEKHYEKLQLNGNVLFERAFGQADEQGVPYVTNIGYQWQSKYQWRSTFGFGLQGMGEMGQWNKWAARAQQNHRAGLLLFGQIPTLGEHSINFNLALLYGISTAAPKQTYRMQFEYEL